MVAWVERQEKFNDRGKVDVLQVFVHTIMIVRRQTRLRVSGLWGATVMARRGSVSLSLQRLYLSV